MCMCVECRHKCSLKWMYIVLVGNSWKIVSEEHEDTAIFRNRIGCLTSMCILRKNT